MAIFTTFKTLTKQEGQNICWDARFLIQSATSYKKIKKRASQKSFDPFYFVGALMVCPSCLDTALAL